MYRDRLPLNLDTTRLETLLGGFARGRVLVVGDLFADEYVTGEVARISREAPVLILHHRDSTVFPGGAANAAANIASLTGQVDMAGVVGTDLMADKLKAELMRRGVDTALSLPDASRPTTTKSRISASSQQSVTQQIVRIDSEKRHALSAELEDQLLAAVRERLDGYDVVLLSDYGNGVLTPRLITELLAVCKAAGKPVTVDSQGDLRRFPGAKVVTPNQPEAEGVVGFKITDHASLLEAGRVILDEAGVEHALITRGAAGMALFGPGGKLFEIPAFNQLEVFDVTGAGDTVVGTLTLALAAGASMEEATVLANVAASIVVRRFGTSVTTPAELRDAWEGIFPTNEVEATR